MSIEFDIASDQIDGARDYQEDAFMVSLMGDNVAGKSCALVVMADGMGGHAAGNVASNMVVATFNKVFQGGFNGKEAPSHLSSALNRANQQIQDSISETPALRGMGCTMVSMFLQGNELYWVSVGDSHLYLIRERELVKQNADHSYGAYIDMMKEQGMDVEEQPGMSRNMLMSAMTGEEISSVDCPETSFKLKPGDRLVIASDGLDTLGAGAIVQYSSWSSTARECVYALLKAVEEANKINQDNTTIIVVDVKEKAKAPSDAPSPPNESLSKGPEAESTSVNDEPPKEKKSRAGLINIILLLLFGGAGYFAWQQGMLDGVISDVTSLVQQQLKTVMSEVQPQPDQIEAPPVVTKPEKVVKKAEIATPASLVVEQTYKDKHDPFTDRLKVGGRAPIMVQITGNDFRMGSSGLIAADEIPRHAVTVPSFAMSIYEVTFAQYDIFAKATRRKQPGSNGLDRKTHPVTDVSWDDALAYTKWLSKQTGKKYRLPSEAEWEFAARGGKRTTYWWGSNKGSGKAHCFDCDSDLNTTKTARVGSYKQNQFGLYDTAGNVYEWVYDCYHRNYRGAPDDGSVWDGGDCSVRIVRGGSFRSPASSMRVENRKTFSSKRGQYNVGIRLVRDI